ncbi:MULTISPECIES: N-acetylglucosamine kinase [Paenibacillus]|uniref:BadF/BadG/BcrA/BcrD ATPase family protein n=1 Tax=Paenibacillus violae TaxID=3077234 RepID=A0ABU3RQL9_9BACL|nr:MULTISPECIES: BadF/BadG/BcrA/BcrD ATPase family protein [Paenibacillus]MDU0206274.1 BadF/BadG/BcrA/BcrD ATPase family protein [Paenibacillus sp. PFR10]MEC0269594.1 BadF/BadG/BcrA/BcrD ATPase family protein [Paenibacillus anseongense]
MKKLRVPLLAFDGGGTKSIVVLTDREGNVLGQGKAGPCNYQGVGKKKAVREIAHGIREAILDLGISEDLALLPSIEIDCAVFGIAGLDTEYDRKVIMEMVQETLSLLTIQVGHLLVHNDGLAALLGATEGQPGVLVIAGTGSIVFGINEFGQTGRTGGWGHRVGDEGSGYWIGKQAVTAILRMNDGRGEATKLQEWVLPHMGFNHVEELFNWVYSADYSVDKLGELSQLVSLAAIAGDHEAKRILSAASEELFVSVRAIIQQLMLTDKPFKLILQGGVLRNISLVRKQLISQIEEYAPQAQIVDMQGEPINSIISMGLVYLKSSISELN